MSKWDGEDLTVDNKVLGDRMFRNGVNSFTSINVLKGDKRYKEGQEMLEQAIEFYLRGDYDDKAAEAAVKLAELYEEYVYNKKKGNPHELAKYYELAGDCLDELNNTKSVQCYKKAAYYYKTNDNFQTAAKVYQTIAQLEAKRDHFKQAIEAYDSAIEAFLLEKSTAHASKCYLEKAEFFVKDGSYKESAECFVDLIKKNYVPFENNALGFKAILAMLVHTAMSQDNSHVEDLDQRLQNLSDTWFKSFERKMVMRIVQGYIKNDEGAFTRAVKDFDSISTLSTWCVDLLLIVKKIMKGQYDISGKDAQYEIIDTTKSPDTDSFDSLGPNDHSKLYHKTATIDMTHSEKMSDLLL